MVVLLPVRDLLRLLHIISSFFIFFHITSHDFVDCFTTSNNVLQINHLTKKNLWQKSFVQNSQQKELDVSSKRELQKDFATIAFPAFVQLAAEPLAGLVDSAYLGRLGVEVLGGAGVAISAQYAVSKLYNDPLLRTSISLVAAQDGKSSEEELSLAVVSVLLLALIIGILQLFVYLIFAKYIILAMGVTPENSMWYSAFSYLKVRALGTPASTLWLVTNGVFRGLGDTKTPLVCSFLFAALNVIFDPIFIFTLNYGASGAAAGTALAQYIALVPLLVLLNKRISFSFSRRQLPKLKSSLKLYLDAGAKVFIRTVAKVLAYSICAREAAALGAVAAAAYNLTFTLGFATTQLCESVAIASQTLLARLIHNKSTSNSRSLLRYLMNKSILIGGIVSLSLSLATFLQRQAIFQGLTTNLDVQQLSIQILPAVMLTQVLKGLAYPVNGIIMGGLDWNFSMLSMYLSNFICIGMIQFWKFQKITLIDIWWALAAFMGVQVVTGIIRMNSGTGIWKTLKEDALEME